MNANDTFSEVLSQLLEATRHIERIERTANETQAREGALKQEAKDCAYLVGTLQVRIEHLESELAALRGGKIAGEGR